MEDHGGCCCGISHLYEFPLLADKAWLDREVDHWMESLDKSHRENNREYNYYNDEGVDTIPQNFKFSHLIEVTLTDHQLIPWKDLLKKKGFRHVSRHLNHNSGNYVNLLLLETGAKNKKKRPFKW